MPLNSDEVNYLIYRYLVESGFDHSAFVFLSETALHDRCIGGQHVERGALIRFLHKGLQYQSLEYHVTRDSSSRKCSAPFNFLKEHICERPIPAIDGQDSGDLDQVQSKKQKNHISSGKNLQLAEEKTSSGSITPSKKQSVPETASIFQNLQLQKSTASLLPETHNSALYNSKPPQSSKTVKTHTPNRISSTKIPETQVTILKGSGSPDKLKMFQCSWNPADSLTIALSGEETVCIWKVSMDSMMFGPQLHVYLKHEIPSNQDTSLNPLEVNSLQWAPTGALLATGTSEGSTWLWSRSGVKIFHARKHTGPVLGMKWNTTGNLIATASIDCKVIVWDTTTFSVKQQLEAYETPIVSLSWLNDEIFAVSSMDTLIYVFKTGGKNPLYRFSHGADVNKVSWSCLSNTLMSCSDDFTLKFWNMGDNPCIWTAVGHENKVNACQWCPTRNLNIVASAASDGTVRIWDVSEKKCLFILNHSYQDVCCLDFSPDGKLLASCTEDGVVSVWSVDSGQIVSTFDAKLQVFETKWNKTGRKLALTLSNLTVSFVPSVPV